MSTPGNLQQQQQSRETEEGNGDPLLGDEA
jgi:hypothetical protein